MFQKFQRKISSSEKKLNDRIAKCSLFNNFNKIRNFHQSASTPSTQKPQSSKQEWNDALVMVSRPPPNVRLVLFHEFGDSGERPILFDSKRVKKTTAPLCRQVRSYSNPDQPSSNCGRDVRPKYEYQYLRCPQDKTELLSEMLFGSVGAVQKVASLKIHHIKNPSAVMLSRVFCLSSTRENTTASLDRGMETHLEALRNNSILSRRKAKTMPVPFSPSTPPSSVASSYSSQSGGFFPRSDSNVSLSSLFSSSGRSASGSLGSAAVRIPFQPQGRAESLPQRQRDSFTLSDESSYDGLPSTVRRTRMKIGFAVICEPEPQNSSEFQQFFFKHFPIIESHMTTLKENIEKALQIRPKTSFLDLMMKALNVFKTKLHNLYLSQRLPEPVWSTLSSSHPDHRKIVVDSFIGDLTRLVTEYNTKQFNYFLSGLLTAVLTHHLGWVTTSTPSHVKKDNTDEEISYNALWAQLGDLYGAVGSPTKVCRTVVTGNGHELVSTLLSVLSYFIRSAKIDEVVSVPKNITPVTMGLETPPPMKAVNLSYVPSDIEESDYVFVSVSDDVTEKKEQALSTPPPASTPVKKSIVKTKSSPKKTEKDDTSGTLSRSHSGPMIKRNERRRSNAFLESNPQNTSKCRVRTFSNNSMSRTKVVQSRRKSQDPEEVTMPTTHNLRSSLSIPSGTHKSKSFSCLSTNGSFCMKQSVDICLPEAPTVEPSDSFFRAGGEDKKIFRSMQQLPTKESETNTICEIIPSFVDRIQPRVERLVNVQRAYPQSELEERTSALPEEPRLPLKNRPDCDPFSSNFSKTSGHSTVKQKSPSRSVSNPSSCAKDSFTKNHRRCFSNSGVKVRVGARRCPLPTSLTSGVVQNSNRSSETADNGSQSESPTFQRLKLMRIPSVEINHNAFDEYFVKEGNDEDSGFKGAHTPSNTTGTFKENVERGETTNIKPTHHVTSCPSFAACSTFSEASQPSTAKPIDLPKDLPQSPAIPSIYPDLTAPPPIPARSNLTLNVKKVYPPLPSKPPVGVIRFNVENEKVSFINNSHKQETIPSPVSVPLQNLSSSRQWPCVSTTTLTQDTDYSDCINLEALPLSDIEKSDPRSPDTDGDDNLPSTGFVSLLADYNQEYLNDFILHGAPNHPDMHQQILEDLGHVVRKPTLDEPIAEAVCILADTDSWSVKVYSSQRLHSDRPCLPALTSKLVSCIINRVATMARMKVDPQFCMNHLEDELRQLVLKSRMLAEYARGHKRVTMGELSAALSIESQDLPLLMAIASCHSPHVAPMML